MTKSLYCKYNTFFVNFQIEMKIISRNKYLSRPRFNRYLNAVGNDNKRAKKLYLANIRLAQAFHPIISQFEVVLRNCINNNLAAHFTDIDWIINQKTGFMSHLHYPHLTIFYGQVSQKPKTI